MKIKLLFAILLLCFCGLNTSAQTNPYTNLDINDADPLIHSDESFKNPDIAVEKVLKNILAKLDPSKPAEKAVSDKLTDYSNHLDDHAIIFIKHPLTTTTDKGLAKTSEQTDQLLSVIVHKESNVYSQYLLETKKILVVMIDGLGTLDDATIKIEKQKGRFQTTFKDMLDLISAVTKAMGDHVTIHLRIVELNRRTWPRHVS